MKNINELKGFWNFKIAGLTGRTFLTLGILALVSSCMQSSHIPSQEYRILKPDFQDTFDIPPPPDGSTERIIQLWSTSYITRQPVPDKNGVPFRDINGVPISDNVSKYEWCMGSQEGSVKTTFKGEDIRITHVGEFKNEPSYFIDCRDQCRKDKKLFKYNCLSPFTSGDKKNHILTTAQVITDPAIKEKLTRMHLKSSYR